MTTKTSAATVDTQPASQEDAVPQKLRDRYTALGRPVPEPVRRAWAILRRAPTLSVRARRREPLVEFLECVQAETELQEMLVQEGQPIFGYQLLAARRIVEQGLHSLQDDAADLFAPGDPDHEKGWPTLVLMIYLRRARMTRSLKLLAMILSTYASKFWRAWPSVSTLALDMECDETWVRTLLRTLKEKGIIRARGFSELGTTIYEFDPAVLRTLQQAPRPRIMKGRRGGSRPKDPRGGHPDRPTGESQPLDKKASTPGVESRQPLDKKASTPRQKGVNPGSRVPPIHRGKPGDRTAQRKPPGNQPRGFAPARGRSEGSGDPLQGSRPPEVGSNPGEPARIDRLDPKSANWRNRPGAVIAEDTSSAGPASLAPVPKETRRSEPPGAWLRPDPPPQRQTLTPETRAMFSPTHPARPVPTLPTPDPSGGHDSYEARAETYGRRVVEARHSRRPHRSPVPVSSPADDTRDQEEWI